MLERKNIRKRHQEIRNEMSLEEIEDKSRRICRALSQSDWYENADEIFCFYPLGNEVDLVPFIKKALSDGKKLSFPRVEGETMAFYQVKVLSDLEEGNFHVMEPVAACELQKGNRQIVLVPGLVFDENGNRYGYGKGYYDRYFSEHTGLLCRYAVAFEHQIEPVLEILDTDIPVTRIYTEEKVRIMECEM